ncbi:helix-turn-helix domain-containing protein [Acidiferrobacter thiooxydans]|uniref:helix-turn-helix domain-containing protein n=1 Tax=Acidiferrobacter thiooxydans TaxID=163359 RepID=UPI000825D897|nr:helix-turn-helix domain-containing protein [Acidiferrobacter thiooxydans]UEO00429.1 helix-turn-helix domain-containing protein [Acidiferrobacter thiooxydans]
MRITIDDIAGMASPGWEGEGCDSDLEVLDLEEDFGEVLKRDDSYSELDFDTERERGEPKPADPEAEPEEPELEPEKPIRYTDGCREGVTTLEICTRLKNEKMTEKNRLEQEFAAILKTYPKNGADLKILLWLANGFSYQQAADLLGRSEKTIRNAARRLRQFRDDGIVKLLPPDKVQTGRALLEPFPPVRSGRPRKAAAPAKAVVISVSNEVIAIDLFGQPVHPRKRRRIRKPGMRRPRVRPVCEGQVELELFQEAA